MLALSTACCSLAKSLASKYPNKGMMTLGSFAIASRILVIAVRSICNRLSAMSTPVRFTAGTRPANFDSALPSNEPAGAASQIFTIVRVCGGGGGR